MSHRAAIVMTFGRTHMLHKCLDSLIRHGYNEWPIYVVHTVPEIRHEIGLVQRFAKRNKNIFAEFHEHDRGCLHAWYKCLKAHPEIETLMKIDDDCWITSPGFYDRAETIFANEPDMDVVGIGAVMPLSAQGAELVIEAMNLKSRAEAITKSMQGKPGVVDRFAGWNYPGTSVEHSNFIWQNTIAHHEVINALNKHYGGTMVPVDRWFQIGAVVMRRWWVDMVMKREGADERIMNEDLGFTFKNRHTCKDPKFRACIDTSTLVMHFSYHQFFSEITNLVWKHVAHIDY